MAKAHCIRGFGRYALKTAPPSGEIKQDRNPVREPYGGSKMGWNVSVDTDKCVGCGECVDVCPVEVYELNDGKSVPANAEECLGCESCVEVCEANAIVVEEN